MSLPNPHAVVVLEKLCTKCRAVKPTEEFDKNKSFKDGFHGWCKSCSYAAKVVRRKANPHLKRATDKGTRERRVARGACAKCGVKPFKQGCITCVACIAKLNKWKRPFSFAEGPCVICGFELSDVHHKDGNHDNNEPSNLVSLCPNHHRLVHRGLLTLD